MGGAGFVTERLLACVRVALQKEVAADFELAFVLARFAGVARARFGLVTCGAVAIGRERGGCGCGCGVGSGVLVGEDGAGVVFEVVGQVLCVFVDF